MHIPDGFLSTKTWGALDIISVLALSLAIFKTKNKIEDKKIPLAGVTAAFIFAAQMLNFPVLPGTSGHFMGGALSAILLGPWTGFLVMASVLIVQCFLFQDGGLLALGANIFNMGIIGSAGGYYIYVIFKKVLSGKYEKAAVFISGWLSIILASAACAIELSISGIVPLIPSIIGMGSIHAAIGIGEGLITVAVISYLQEVRMDVLELAKI